MKDSDFLSCPGVQHIQNFPFFCFQTMFSCCSNSSNSKGCLHSQWQIKTIFNGHTIWAEVKEIALLQKKYCIANKSTAPKMSQKSSI